MKHSKRHFVIQTSYAGVTEQIGASITEIEENNEAEVFYALQESMDSVLDLRRNESIYFQPNRDDGNSRGIITRIK